MEKINSQLVVYNNNNNTTIATSTSLNRPQLNFSNRELDEALVKEIYQKAEDNIAIVVVNAQCSFPEFWLQRLCQTIESVSDIEILSALTTNIYELSPLDAQSQFLGDITTLDNLLYLLQSASTFFTNQINPDCFVIKNKQALLNLNNLPKRACNNLLVQTLTSSTEVIELTDKKDIGDQKPLPAHPLSLLHWKLKPYLSTTSVNNNYPFLDQKPCLLHITMNWGGGVAQWINDYCKHDNNYHHFILVSNGELYRQTHGESYTLHYSSTDGVIVDCYEMQAPIAMTSIEHPEYAKVLNSVIDRFQIQKIVVSSLIGHSSECLQTGLQTIRVFHDYFPSWPSLIANLEKKQLNPADLELALLQTKNQPFGEISKSKYENIKKHLHLLYLKENIELVAPSQSVIDNLNKIDSDSFKEIQLIPHAIESLKPISYQNQLKKFYILVLGRINPPKGQELLEAVIDKLGPEFRFAFVGAGNEGKKYLKTKNIVVIMDYDKKSLPRLLQESQPDIALITSLTSETFNYTLSELQQAGICTVSTKFGALKERIIDGKTGFLVDADANDIANLIIDLNNHPEKIQAVRNNLAELEFNTFESVTASFESLLGETSPSNYRITTNETNETNQWIKQLAATEKEKTRTKGLLQNSERTLKERTIWAKDLTDQNKISEENIKLERQQVTHLKTVVKQDSKRFKDEINSLKSTLENETARMQSEIKGLNQDYEQLNSNHESLIKDLNCLQDELDEVYASRSWRVTKPMRQFTTWARHKRNAIKFRWMQLKSLPTRFTRSLKTRGVSGTASIVKQKISKSPEPTNKVEQVELTQNFEAIKIESSQQPLVSIIIPVYNHFEHTYNCLKSIAELKDKCSFEVIVVDDCSSDDTQDQIQLVSGITYQRQAQNGGFIESCNTGAKMANGQYLMFLNNDTVVHSNWLDSLVEVFNNYGDAGLVGSKLIYPTNQLQEAGGIIFSDASGWNYGRMGNPDEPWFNHIREVDYCSGASILVTKKLFETLGYFDERYKPAYYEDTDLAFGVRKSGKKVYIQPASVVTHFEGISSGTDLTAGVKKYQVVNQQKFKEKWARELSKQPKSGTDIELCRIHGQPKRILIFDACTPTPDQDSGSLRMLNLIKILKQLNYHVVFMAENLSFVEGYTTILQQLGVECIYTPTITNPVDYLKDKGRYFDEIILSRYYVAEPVMPFIREYCPKAKLIFDTVDLHFVRERRMAELAEDKKLAKIAEETRVKELAVAKACDTTLVVSPYEVGVLNEELPDTDVKVLTNIHEIYGCRKPYNDRKDIMFIGGYQHTPNVDAVEWFVESIFPLIEKQLPDLKFHIIGSKAPKHIQQMSRQNIVFHGFVEDIEPFMDEIRIAVAPLRYGAGVKGKVNMSMSYGQPVVGTKCAVEGMYAQEGVDVLMAETPEQFASQIIRLYQNEQLWNTVSEGGLANVQNYFSFEAAKAAIENILD